MDINSNERWITMKELMDYLNISRDTALKWIANKGLPSHKVGRNWRFRTSEIDEWIKSGAAADKED